MKVANALGCHKKVRELSAFYFVLVNIPPENRSALHVIQPAVLCKEQDLGYFGPQKVLLPLIHDLKILESEGIQLSDGNKTISGTVALLVGDNLGIHHLSGFSECFSGGPSHRICRFCMATNVKYKQSTKNLCSEQRRCMNVIVPNNILL